MKAILIEMFSALILTIREIFRQVLLQICDVTEECFDVY